MEPTQPLLAHGASINGTANGAINESHGSQYTPPEREGPSEGTSWAESDCGSPEQTYAEAPAPATPTRLPRAVHFASVRPPGADGDGPPDPDAGAGASAYHSDTPCERREAGGGYHSDTIETPSAVRKMILASRACQMGWIIAGA